MECSAQGLGLIRHLEGFSATPYRCPAGYWTIGYGHLFDAKAPASITPEEALTLLRTDVRIAGAAVGRFIHVPLMQHQFDALASFAFNLGSGALQCSSLRRVINRGEHDAVPHQLQRWVWGGGHRLPGLVRRRAAEAALYQGLYALTS